MINRYDSYIGADPEFLFEKDGKVVESSVALKKGKIDYGYGDIIRDGYQGEFNPDAHTCRQVMSNRLASAVAEVNGMGYKVKIGAGHWVPESEFADLTKASKEFGCVPSENAYGSTSVGADPTTYMFRPLGGHIHMTLGYKAKEKYGKLIRLMDIFVGMASVPFDQDPLQVERRKHYGRAGEFRIKPYGIEYRTLSNFWLSDYVYVSMVYGLARQAISIAEYMGWDKVDKVINLFSDGEVAEIINSNDKARAIEAFKKLRPFILEKFTVDDVYEEQLFTLSDLTFDTFVKFMVAGKVGDKKIATHATPPALIYNSYGIERTLIKYAGN